MERIVPIAELQAEVEEMSSPEAWDKLARARQEMAEGKWAPHEEVVRRLRLDSERE